MRITLLQGAMGVTTERDTVQLEPERFGTSSLEVSLLDRRTGK